MANTWSLGDSIVGEHNKLLHFVSSFFNIFPWPLSDDRSLSFSPTHCICPNAVIDLQQTGSRTLILEVLFENGTYFLTETGIGTPKQGGILAKLDHYRNKHCANPV